MNYEHLLVNAHDVVKRFGAEEVGVADQRQGGGRRGTGDVIPLGEAAVAACPETGQEDQEADG